MEEKDLAQAVPAKQQIPENERVPLKEKIFYGMGALMDGGGVALMSCVMLNYTRQARLP